MTASTGENVVAIVADEPLLMDEINVAQTQKTLYSTVSAPTGSVSNPRAVTGFTETTGDFRTYSVIRFDESAADGVTWKWFCEALRQNFGT